LVRVGTQQSIDNPLQWTMKRRQGQQEKECNNQIEVEYVRCEWAVGDSTRRGGGQREANGRQITRQEGGGGK
jgi:hypothetical protein